MDEKQKSAILESYQNDMLATIDNRIEKRVKTMERCKHVYGRVIEVNDNNTYATVQLGENEKSKVRLLNKTAEILAIGDYVQIHYWNSIGSDGIIRVRHGEANNAGGGGSFYIENATVITEGQAPTYTKETEIINIDVKNQKKTLYGNIGNPFICDGHYIVWSAEEECDKLATEIKLENYWKSTETFTDTWCAQISEFQKTDVTEARPLGWSWDFNFYVLNEEMNWSGRTTNIVSDYGGNRDKFLPEYYGILLIAQKLYPPNATHEFGYCQLSPHLCVYNPEKELKLMFYSYTLVHSTTSSYVNLDFATQAEYDYAMGVTGRAELQPTNGGNV